MGGRPERKHRREGAISDGGVVGSRPERRHRRGGELFHLLFR